jgi:anti-sigma factor RsiW
MAKIVRMSKEQRENLVAYLDGELEDQAAREIEQVLASSPVARHDVDMLSRTWDLVGELPGVSVTQEFTSKTLDSIAASRGGPKVDPEAISRNTRRVLGLAMAGVILGAAGTTGFLATQRWIPNEAEEILNDFEILMEFDKYREVGDLEQLRKLQEIREFSETDDDTP